MSTIFWFDCFFSFVIFINLPQAKHVIKFFNFSVTQTFQIFPNMFLIIQNSKSEIIILILDYQMFKKSVFKKSDSGLMPQFHSYLFTQDSIFFKVECFAQCSNSVVIIIAKLFSDFFLLNLVSRHFTFNLKLIA